MAHYSRLFPSYRQLDTMDCGPVCLKLIAKFYGQDYSLPYLRNLCHITRDGVSLLGLSDAAEAIGLNSLAVRLSWQQLRDEAELPCVVHWNNNHFVVVYKIRHCRRRSIIYVSDPALGIVKYSEEEFLTSWMPVGINEKGVALFLEPTSNFNNNSERSNTKTTFSKRQVLSYLYPYKQNVLQLLLSMVVASSLNLLFPFITQSIVDHGVSLGRIDYVVVMLIAQFAIIIGQLVNNLIKGWLVLHLTARISISLISDFLAKLMRLPIAFFDAKKTGDILQRIQDHSRIQSFLTNSLLSIVLAMILVLLYGAILGGYNLKILFVFSFGSICYIIWVLFFLKWRRKLDGLRFHESANNQSCTMQLINGMQEIKLNHCEKQKRWEWEHIQARLFRINVNSLKLSQIQQIGGTFIDQSKNVLISFLAAKSVIDGNMTLGMMTALSYIVGQLNAPVGQFISFVSESQDASISMERLGEIHNLDDEEPTCQNKITEINNNYDIELTNVSFQYDGPHSPKVLDGITMRIPNGKITAIVGASGSGKSTILKMLLGFYSPVQGRITLGGVDLCKYSESSWRQNCGCVLQEGFIFSNTIAENIALCDDRPNFERVKMAAEIANIKDWIEQLPLGYNTLIGSEGHGLSIGQKQRILIARAAYKNSPYLFFDEATNSLDANNERTIMNNLSLLFENRTVVIIAHRLSTVKNADNIIVLDNGRIVEEGGHDFLCSLKGHYYELVRNQLELE